MNSGIVDSTSISSRPEVPNSLLIAPSNPISKPRSENSDPSAVAASMIVNSGAPQMKNSARRMMRRVTMSVPRSHLLGRRLASRDVVDVDEHVKDGVDDDHHAADRDEIGEPH